MLSHYELVNLLFSLGANRNTGNNNQQSSCSHRSAVFTCEDIKEYWPNSASGYYNIIGNGGTSKYLYCDMDESPELCGSKEWTRIAYLNMSNSTQSCPSGFRQYQSMSGVRACGRPETNNGSCVSVQFPANGISYSQVCGRVVGYSFGNPDAINNKYGSNHSNINADYVDGVSITHGYPRQHVWTLMASSEEFLTLGGKYNCPCVNGSVQVPQNFVGNHYFCEGSQSWNDTLWDGKECPSDEALCCVAPGIPWFYRDFGSTTTTDYLELRVCANQDTDDEDIPVGYYEIYIK